MAPSKQDTVKSIHASSDLILVKEHLRRKSCSSTCTKRKADTSTAPKKNDSSEFSAKMDIDSFRLIQKTQSEEMQKFRELQRLNPVNVKNKQVWESFGLQPPGRRRRRRRRQILTVKQARINERERQQTEFLRAINDLNTPMGDKTKISDF